MKVFLGGDGKREKIKRVIILHLAIGKQKGAGGISNAECGVRKDGGWGLGLVICAES